MKFSDLSGLWLLAFALPLVLLYLLQTQRTRVRVGSSWLWQQAARELHAERPFRRLRWVLPLLLQLLALVLLALAATRPFSRGGDVLEDDAALVIDISASMQATDDAGTARIQLAKDWAKRYVERRSSGEVMLITAGHGVTVTSPFDRDRVRLLRAIDTVRAEDGEGSLHPAVELARARLQRGSGKRRVVVLTDGAWADRTPLVGGDVALEIVQLGQATANTGLVHVDARADKRARDNGDYEVRVFARVRNFGDTRADRFVTLRQRNVKEPLASRRLQLAPDEDTPVVLTFLATAADQGAGLIVELSPNDRFDVDDRAYTVVPEARLQRVVLFERRPSPWLERALRADPEAQVFRARDVAEMQAAGADGAFLVYSGVCPDTLPGGHFLIVDPDTGPCLTTRIGAALEAPRITSWRETDPRLRFLNLAEVHVQRARVLDASNEREVLVRTQGGPIVSELELQGRVGTLVGFDFADSDWPLKASFVLFVRNLVEQAREHRLGAAAIVARTGSTPALTLPLDITRVSLAYARGDYADAEGPSDEVVLPAKQGIAALPPITRAGFHQVSWEGENPKSTLLAASLASERESELRERALPEALGSANVHAQRAAQDLVDWSWVWASMALLLLLFEVTYATRRRSAKPSLRAVRHAP